MALEVKDLEQIKALIVDPITTAVREEVAALIRKDEQQEERIKSLETNQKRALAGLAAAAGALSLAVGFSVDWLRKKVGL